jgi:hypothetical protein
MRAADAIEKFSRESSCPIQPFKSLLIQLAQETKQKEVRWHLALILPRLRLTGPDRVQLVEILHSYLNDKSSIVKTFAMQSLFEVAQQVPALQPEIYELLENLTRTGTPAMRARGRNLLKAIQRS